MRQDVFTRSLFIVAVLSLAFAAQAAIGADGPGTSPNWIATFAGDLQDHEYQFTLGDDGSLTAPNRAQGLRTTVGANGWEPDAGAVFYCQIRAQNTCPMGQGTLGTGSDGVERDGRSCP